LPNLPLPNFLVAQFSVAQFTVAQFSIAHFTVAQFTVYPPDILAMVTVFGVCIFCSVTDSRYDWHENLRDGRALRGFLTFDYHSFRVSK